MKKAVLEGLLFLNGEDGLLKEDISKILEISLEDTEKILEEYKQDLEKEDRGLRLAFLGNSYKLITKPEHKQYYEKFTQKVINQTLSQSALETLAIIAYKQPITVGQIDEIRGVSSRDMIRKLIIRGLIEPIGKSDLPGKPMLYNTTNKFLDYFNLSSVNELPKISFDVIKENEEKDLFNSKYKENI